MNLVPYDINELGAVPRLTNNQGLIEEFAKSPNSCMEVLGFRHKNAKVAATSFWKTIRSLGYQGRITTVVRGDRLFLIKF